MAHRRCHVPLALLGHRRFSRATMRPTHLVDNTLHHPRIMEVEVAEMESVSNVIGQMVSNIGNIQLNVQSSFSVLLMDHKKCHVAQRLAGTSLFSPATTRMLLIAKQVDMPMKMDLAEVVEAVVVVAMAVTLNHVD